MICLSETIMAYIMSSIEVKSEHTKFEEPKYYYFPILKANSLY